MIALIVFTIVAYKILTFAKIFFLVRFTEHNDWVIFIVLGCIISYIFMLLSLQREATFREYILQQFPDSSNGFLSWLITSAVFTTLLSVLFSQYIPVLPAFITGFHPFGFELNKFGFTFLTLILFYTIKLIFTYVYFLSVGDGKKWSIFYFTANKFYFLVSILLIIACLAHYYFHINREKALHIYFISAIILFIFKNIYYLFNKNGILPGNWYYKFLYICTLQIIPVLVVWKLLFL